MDWVFQADPNGKPRLSSLVKSRTIKAKVKAKLQEGYVPQYDYGHEVYFCQHCMDFHEKFYFRLTKGESIYEPRYFCPTYRHALIHVTCIGEGNDFKILDQNGKPVAWKCRVCGSEELIKDDSGSTLCWD